MDIFAHFEVISLYRSTQDTIYMTEINLIIGRSTNDYAYLLTVHLSPAMPLTAINAVLTPLFSSLGCCRMITLDRTSTRGEAKKGHQHTREGRSQSAHTDRAASPSPSSSRWRAEKRRSSSDMDLEQGNGEGRNVRDF